MLFWLSPGDLVYVPSIEEEGRIVEIENIKQDRIYKVVSCTENECHCIPHFVASPIVKTDELGANNKAQRAWSGEMIKETCIKIKMNRLGQIVKI